MDSCGQWALAQLDTPQRDVGFDVDIAAAISRLRERGKSGEKIERIMQDMIDRNVLVCESADGSTIPITAAELMRKHG